MCHLLCFQYLLSPLFHSMMLLVKTIKTKTFVTVKTMSAILLLSPLLPTKVTVSVFTIEKLPN